MTEIENLYNEYFTLTKLGKFTEAKAILPRLTPVKHIDKLRMNVILANEEYIRVKNEIRRAKQKSVNFARIRHRPENPIVSKLEDDLVSTSKHLVETQKALEFYIRKNNVDVEKPPVRKRRPALPVDQQIKLVRAITDNQIKLIKKQKNDKIQALYNNMDAQIARMRQTTENQIKILKAHVGKQINVHSHNAEVQIANTSKVAEDQIKELSNFSKGDILNNE